MTQGLTRKPPAEPSEDDHQVKSFEHAPVGLTEVDGDGRFIGVNQRFCDITGWPREHLLGRLVSEITHPDHREDDARILARLLAGEIGYYETEKRYLRPNGAPVWVDLRVSRIDGQSGEASAVGVVQDISERKWAQERGYESARMLEIAVNATGLGLWDLVPATGEVQSTRRCWELLGL